MKRIVLAGVAAIALAALPPPAKANGPLGFTIGGGASLSFFIAPLAGGGGGGWGDCGNGSGPYYPGYAGCGRKGMWPAYAYMNDPGCGYPGGYYGGFDGADSQYTPPAPKPGNGNSNGSNGNGSNGNEGQRPRSSSPPVYYPTQGYAYYPYGGYAYPPGYWYGH
jgi:hypothetical protein